MNPVRNQTHNLQNKPRISNGVKVLMIGSDRNIFKEHSEARRRIAEYGTLVEELHIVVLSTRIRNQESGIRNEKISLNVRVYPTNSISRWLYLFDAYRIAKKIIHNSSFLIHDSLITCQDPFECGFAGWCAARKFGISLQLQIHTDFLSPYFSSESLLNKIRIRIARFIIPRATRIRVVSERIKKSLVSRFTLHASRIDVLPIFTDTEKIKNAPVRIDLRKKYPQFDFIALMASRFTKEKNIPLAISAMAEVVKKYPRAGLIIVGDGPEKKNYESGIRNYELEDNIIIENWTDDLASYYKTADVFLITSDYEGYGRTAVEALAAGLPVVMTDVGIAGEFIINGENGLVVPVGDAHALADAIGRIISGEANIRAALPKMPTKEEYLAAYQASWMM